MKKSLVMTLSFSVGLVLILQTFSDTFVSELVSLKGYMLMVIIYFLIENCMRFGNKLTKKIGLIYIKILRGGI
jgi:hypothetical protein